MKIDEVSISDPGSSDDKLLAVADVLITGTVAIHGIKIIASETRVFLSMPSMPIRKRCHCGKHNIFAARYCNWCGSKQEKMILEGGQRLYHEIVHPVDKISRAEMTDAIIGRYQLCENSRNDRS